MRTSIRFSWIVLIWALCEPSIAVTLDDLSKSVVYIREDFQAYETIAGKKYELWLRDPANRQSVPKTERFSGTGFLLAHKGKIYLVTAAHIARKVTGGANVLWNSRSGEMHCLTLDQIRRSVPGARWFVHPSADVAVHPFGFTEKTDHMLVPDELCWDSVKKVLPIGTDVYVFGYPLGLGTAERLSPLSKKAEISSSLTSVAIPGVAPNLLFVLLDQDLAQGYSGAPIFVSPETQFQGNAIVREKPELIGLQSMTISDTTGGKISVVVPTQYLKELFERAEFLEYERTRGITPPPEERSSSGDNWSRPCAEGGNSSRIAAQ